MFAPVTDLKISDRYPLESGLGNLSPTVAKPSICNYLAKLSFCYNSDRLMMIYVYTWYEVPMWPRKKNGVLTKPSICKRYHSPPRQNQVSTLATEAKSSICTSCHKLDFGPGPDHIFTLLFNKKRLSRKILVKDS